MAAVSMPPGTRGFTLVEVLIALAITAFVAVVSYNGLSTVISGVGSTRAVAEQTWELNRALMILGRDLRHFVPRPVRDGFHHDEVLRSRNANGKTRDLRRPGPLDGFPLEG